MVLSNFRTEIAFHRGYRAEEIIAKILRDEGYYVVFLADNQERGQNGAPGARNRDDFITLPDLAVFLRGKQGYVEIKFKASADFTVLTGREEHGIGKRKWEMYCKIQKETGSLVYLFIYEGNSGAILYATIDELAPLMREYNGDKMDPGGMVFFARASFDLWGKIAVVDGQIYDQLWLFSEDEGDKLFKLQRKFSQEHTCKP